MTRYTSKKDRATLFLRQNGKCDCGAKLEQGNFIIEHIQPLSRGGSDTLDNKKLNCRSCADAKTFHPRSKATTLSGDNFEFHKTNRLKEGPRPAKRPMGKTKGFVKRKRPMESQWVDNTRRLENE